MNLKKIGSVYLNPSAKWSSPALSVPKPGTDQFCFTVALRGVNGMTMTIQSSMPRLNSQLQKCADRLVFAN